MGTNYFAKLNIEKVTKGMINPTVMTLNILKDFYLHIGKASAGWKFLFREQTLQKERVSLNSWKKWKTFLKRDEIIIYDEYHNLIDKKSFIKLVEDKQKDIHPTQGDIKEYFVMYSTRYKDTEGYWFDKEEFS